MRIDHNTMFLLLLAYPRTILAWCAPLGFQGSSFVKWFLGGLKHKLHRLWTVLRAYVFIASRIYPGCFWLDLPLWVSRLAVFVNWSLGGEGHKAQRTGCELDFAHIMFSWLRTYPKHTFCLMCPFGFPGKQFCQLIFRRWRAQICFLWVQHLATCSTPESWFSIVIYSTRRLAAH